MATKSKTDEGLALTPDNTTGEMVPVTKEQIAAWLRGEDLTEEDETPEVDLEEALRILSAETPGETLKVNELRKIDDLAGSPFTVLSVTWRKSTRSDDGTGRYAVIRCASADGEEFLTTCGATKVVLQLRKFQVAGWLPATFELRVTETSNNRTVKELVAPSPDF